MYKKRDRVKIRKDLEEGKMYGDRYVNSNMTQYAGKEATIKTIYNNGTLGIDLDNGNWYWSPEMFEPLITSEEILTLYL